VNTWLQQRQSHTPPQHPSSPQSLFSSGNSETSSEASILSSQQEEEGRDINPEVFKINIISNMTLAIFTSIKLNRKEYNLNYICGSNNTLLK